MALVAHVRRHVAGRLRLFHECSVSATIIPFDEIQVRKLQKTKNGFGAHRTGTGAAAFAAAVVAVVAVNFAIAVATRTQRDDGRRGLGCSRQSVHFL